MKIKSVKIKNVKSFKDETEIDFSQDFNILIGPNGSGKSNLLDILTICIRKFFLISYSIVENTDSSGIFKTINQNDLFNDLQRNLEKFYDDDTDSEIEFRFLVSEEDITNLKKIVEDVSLYEERAKEYRNYGTWLSCLKNITTWDISLFKQEEEISYKIRNNSFNTNLIDGSQEKCFFEYLNMLELLLILGRESNARLSANYLYFSPYRGANIQNLQANLSGQDFYSILQSSMGATSKTISSLINLATLYFSMKRRGFENEACSEGYNEKWKADEEVKLVTKYLEKMGYGWELELRNKNKNIYEIMLTKENKKFFINQASSGEQEIINFLMGIFAFHIKNGLIIIDEPELHLHPKWQKELLELFIELSRTTKNQLIICTHSPIFINEKTYNHVIRIYKDSYNISNKVVLKDTESFKLKDILHIVTTTNNEKIFFADLVILVEGLTDLLVFQKITRDVIDSNNIPKVIEVIAIQGKHNQGKFSKFLDSLNIPSFFIADLDFINEIGTEKVKSLFKVNKSKIVKDVLQNSKSKDGKQLINYLEEAVSTNKITEELKDLLEYIKTSHRKLKSDLKDEENDLLNDFIHTQKESKIYILRRGDIEDYFPKGFHKKDMDKVIDLLGDRSYVSWKKDEKSYFADLLNIVNEIIGIKMNE